MGSSLLIRVNRIRQQAQQSAVVDDRLWVLLSSLLVRLTAAADANDEPAVALAHENTVCSSDRSRA